MQVQLSTVFALRQPVQEKCRAPDGILITLPNFGDEKGVADTIGVGAVPSLRQAYPDDLNQFTVERRRRFLR
ncbi:MAG: hypothetical protein U5O16_37680 [Rhodococcus sp. (in: high G+C Gram-positive bacteria)]|nr:hypothetical protein [Rhodococcus sp. (in: high G+C Gram-positive bacteria)]